jgi:tetratricopeptide (TPR) repeat protein
MRRALIQISVVALLATGLLVPVEAHAWGPRAMQSITAMSLQMLSLDFPNIFRPGGAVGTNFEVDVLNGARDGVQVLGGAEPLNNDREAVLAMGNQVALLREARKFGPTSYFAYRMGVLASLTANVFIPFGFAWTEEEKAIQAKVMEDIDRNLDSYGFIPEAHNREFVRDAVTYMKMRRGFYAEDKILIASDYKSGVGYRGFMKQGGRAYFTKTAETVADVWNTVLRAEPAGREMMRPSPRSLTWYFVDEMAYLLKNKSNVQQAKRVYENFEKVNPQIVEAYEKVGDIFYAVDSRDSKLRGIDEWQKAYSLGGPERARLGKKLANHYLDEGKVYLERAAKPGSEDSDLPTALNSFEQALTYDRTSQDAAKLIQDTNTAIQARNERLEMTINIISTGEKVRAEADNFRDKQDWANAIKTYRQAIGFFEAVDEEFKEQAGTAKENVRKLKKSIQDVVNDVLDAASSAIDDGDRAKEANRFDEAIGAYDRVGAIVSVIPDDENPTVLTDKANMAEMAGKKKEEANVAKVRYETALQDQAKQPAAGGAAAPRPAVAAPAAPAVPAAPK